MIIAVTLITKMIFGVSIDDKSQKIKLFYRSLFEQRVAIL